MRHATGGTAGRGVWVRAAIFVGTLVVTTACNGSDDNCPSAPTSFVVYEPGAAVSAIPLCTAATDVPATPSFAPDGSTSESFPGTSPLSAAGAAQCQALCALATATLPCCVSVWEPSTVLCPPACVP